MIQIQIQVFVGDHWRWIEKAEEIPKRSKTDDEVLAWQQESSSC